MNYLLHDVFDVALRQYGDRIAVRDEGRPPVSYRELGRMSDCFANLLKDERDSETMLHTFVGILAYVNSRSISAVLGILKSGHAYVPLDLQSPPERLSRIIRQAKLSMIVVQKSLLDKFYPLFCSLNVKKIIVFDGSVQGLAHSASFDDSLKRSFDSSRSDHQVRTLAEDLAYILHSSGSTGEPKGIMLTHRNARNFVDWMQKEFQLNCNDVVMSRSPFNFDLSVFDIFNGMLAGASIVCFDWEKGRAEGKHRAYVRLLEQQCATFLYTTPSALVTLMHRGGLGQNNNHLRTIMYAGEPFPIPRLKELCSLLPDIRVANIYGPTETNIITCFWIDRICDDWESVPLGKVVDDTEIIIVNDAGDRVCNTREVGELWCRGGTVTLGYLGKESLTRQCLVKSPFHAYPVHYWKTGDYGYRDDNGILHYRGRRDHLVKIKSYRVELGEIESALARMNGVSEACVVFQESSVSRLTCFYSTRNGETISNEAFESHLSKYLPGYMIPSEYHYYEELPKTSSGKVDRMLLQE